MYEASSNRFYREPLREHPVLNLNEYTQIYAERVPEEEARAYDKNFIHVLHFQTEPNRVHGVPFKFLLKEASAILLGGWGVGCLGVGLGLTCLTGREICRHKEAARETYGLQGQEL